MEGRSRRPGRGNELDTTIATHNHGIKGVRMSRKPSIVNHNLTALIQPAHGVVRRGGADNKAPRRSGGSRRYPNPNRLNPEVSI